MKSAKQGMGIAKGEILFMVLLHIILLFSFSYDKRAQVVQFFQFPYFFAYALGAFVINYYLLPRYFYQKRYYRFFGYVVLVIIAIIIVDELVIEQIFFPDTRGRGFPGVIYTLLQVMPIVIILTGFKFAWDASVKQREVEQLRASVQESELQFLKSQINPHFLFNNMNNLYSHALTGSAKTPEIILELSAVLRYMLYECKEKFVPLTKEIEQMHNFIKLSKLQIEDRGRVRFAQEAISPEFKIAPLILIVFIENAFKHSQSGQSENIEIDVDVRMEGNTLHFRCANNFEEAASLDTVAKGIGLENVRKRLQLLYPNKHRLEITSEDNRYQVALDLELEKL